MLDREACERRVYRLATLLTGDPVRAARVIEAVVGAQPDLRRLDSAHLDRLTVLRSREVAPATIADPRLPLMMASALASLPHQQREAWVLSEVYRLPRREVARAMDCSVSATERHLDGAKAALHERLGDEARALAGAALAYTMRLDVPEFHRAVMRRRRRMRRLVMLAVIIAVVAGLIVAGDRWLWAEW